MSMKTHHEVVIGDSRDLQAVEPSSIDLVVTSPPYPMVEMWDELFSEMDGEISSCMESGDVGTAFSLMHDQLDMVWSEVDTVLSDGGIVCVNIGDATRNIGDSFRLFPNHSQIIDAFSDMGYTQLPGILWRKPTNSSSKFMGSGMIPPNAYVTMEHEHILIFRKGDKRSFESGSDLRYESSYFWEERNQWFSDLWTGINGADQYLSNDARDRSAAFPIELPYRLINMFSQYGETVFDPFWGTGTTSLAAIVAGRNSVGSELDPEFVDTFESRLSDVDRLSAEIINRRLDSHVEFVRSRLNDDYSFEYRSENYDFPVMTKQEQPIKFHSVSGFSRLDEAEYSVSYDSVDPDSIDSEFGSHVGNTPSISDFVG